MSYSSNDIIFEDEEKSNTLIKTLKKLSSIALMLLIPILIIVSWETLSKVGYINKSILPSPSKIFKTFLEMSKSGELLNHLQISIIRVFKGFFIGTSVGIVVGIFIGLFKKIDLALTLVIGILRPIPIIAWVPMLILWMGIDEGSKVTVIAIGSFWPILLNTVHGIKSTDKKYLEVAAILEKNKFKVLTSIVFPAALPSIFTGLRIGIGIAWMCVVGAELIAASSGIGYLIMYARELSQPDVMLVGVFSIGIIGLLIDFIIRKIETKLLKWNIINQK